MKIEERIAQAVGHWQKALQLDNWEINLEFGEIEDATAEVTADTMYDTAWVKFNVEKLAKKSDDYIQRTIIHELLHLHDRDRQEMFSSIEENLNPEVFRLYENVIYKQTEAFIDRLATIIYNSSLTKQED